MTYLSRGRAPEASLTVAETVDRALAVAAALREAGLDEGERALLVYPPGLDYVTAFLGCLFAHVVAVPIYPPDPTRLERTLPRFLSVVGDCSPSVVLSTSPVASMMGALAAMAPGVADLPRIATDALADGSALEPRPVTEETVALIQYTSGSTSQPKGVVITHGNLTHNLELIRDASECSEASTLVTWLPQYHDMGLVTGILEPLYTGFPLVMLSPIDFLKRPVRWLEAISRYRATHSGGPNFGFDHCVRRVDAAAVAALDLSSWRVAYNGAEPIRPETLEAFAHKFGPAGFREESFLPCYGLAEATVGVSWTRAGEAWPTLALDRAALRRGEVLEAASDTGASAVLVSSGRPRRDQVIRVVDPESREPVEDRRIGEIWVASPSVSTSYWEQPELTERLLRATTAEGEGPYLRTGDLGFLDAGELYVTGRLKDLLVVAGQNHYPQDVEHVVHRAHPDVRVGCCAAFTVTPHEGPEQVVVAAELSALDPSALDALQEIARAIRAAVSEAHELRIEHVQLLPRGRIPKTSSGKVRRHACREAFEDGSLQGVRL